MIPVVAIVGRPNVGKSTIFNCLTRTRDALVAEIAGLTRDRQYGYGKLGNKQYIVVDTGGLIENAEGIEQLMQEQVQQALQEATLILFVVDGSQSMTTTDEEIAQSMRHFNKPTLLVVNKTDKADLNECRSDFSRLGYAQMLMISAIHRRGVTSMAHEFCESLPESEKEEVEDNDTIRVSIVGRPNAGKSTLVNQLANEERVLTSDLPGTTRDSISVPLIIDGQNYKIIDTAGLRRRRSVHETIEKFSAIKTIESIEKSNVTVLMIDATLGINDLDITLAAMAIDIGRGLIIALNKWDLLNKVEKDHLKSEILRRASFLDFAQQIPISALKNQGIPQIFQGIKEAHAAAFAQISTTDLNTILQSAIEHHAPPSVNSRRVKLRYAHIGGHNPPIIVIHGNSVTKLAQSYKRYLEGVFRKAFNLYGTPIRLIFKVGENPFSDRKHQLNPKQQQKKRKLMKFVKNKKTKN